MLSPVARKLYSVRLCLSVLPDDHLVQEPAAASALAVVSDPDPADLPDGYSLDHKLI